MSVPPKVMNNEIANFDVFFLHDSGKLEQVFNVLSTTDYNHYEYEAHHFVPYTDWVMNTKNVQSQTDQRIIIIRKKAHQHLENPEYRLPKDKFIEIYHILPEKLLFDVNKRDGQYLMPYKKIRKEPEYDGCFDDVDFQAELKKNNEVQQ
ncbi:MAG: hypothetical protein WCG95_00170 [bacterium]